MAGGNWYEPWLLPVSLIKMRPSASSWGSWSNRSTLSHHDVTAGIHWKTCSRTILKTVTQHSRSPTGSRKKFSLPLPSSDIHYQGTRTCSITSCPIFFKSHTSTLAPNFPNKTKQNQSSTTPIPSNFQVLFPLIFPTSFFPQKKSILLLSRASHSVCVLSLSLPSSSKMFHQFLSLLHPNNQSIKLIFSQFHLLLKPRPMAALLFTTKPF